MEHACKLLAHTHMQANTPHLSRDPANCLCPPVLLHVGPPVGRRRGVLVLAHQEPLFDGAMQSEPGFTLPRLDNAGGGSPLNSHAGSVAKMIMGGHGKHTRKSTSGIPTDGDSPTGHRGTLSRSISEKEVGGLLGDG